MRHKVLKPYIVLVCGIALPYAIYTYCLYVIIIMTAGLRTDNIHNLHGHAIYIANYILHCSTHRSHNKPSYIIIASKHV